MGTWGMGGFDNDEALEWLDDLDRDDPLPEPRLALESTRAQWIGAAEAARAVAACELLARLMTRQDLPAGLQGVTLSPSAAKRAVKPAVEALHRVTMQSELTSMWAQSGKLEEWCQAMGDIEERLWAAKERL